ncbi:manganese-dependent peroxidase [Mycena metata]|uniref:Peroxidase n=1 Tax=Mycena metata TaxID=1033252 RepID=A0AAD7IV59_9AGAR|nr:manganese-dependent peroxidase [Mycena metata]
MLSTTFSLLAVLVTVSKAALTKRMACPDGNLVSNLACCALFPVLEDIQTNMFADDDCSEAAHATLRVAFHDAIGWSLTQPSFGTGADGSIFIFAEQELSYDANLHIADAFNLEAPFIANHSIGVADFIQFAAAVGLTKCPGVLRPPFLLGRVDATAPAPDGTVPEPFQNVTTILARMADAGFSPAELVALLASHSIGGVHTAPNSPGLPFDSTPSTFDTQFYLETLLTGTLGTVGNGAVETAIAGTLRLQSDSLLARDLRTSCLWQANVNNQALMATSFQAAFAKMQVVGQNILNMVDCSDVIPEPPVLSTTAAQAFYPPGLSRSNIQQSCLLPFPILLPTKPGAPETVPPIAQDPATDGPCQDDGSDCVASFTKST